MPVGDSRVAPIIDEEREALPIISTPEKTDIIANRLFLFLENEDGNIDALASDFKSAYPDNRYAIVGFDRQVKLLVIQVPENERDLIRNTINEKLLL